MRLPNALLICVRQLSPPRRPAAPPPCRCFSRAPRHSPVAHGGRRPDLPSFRGAAPVHPTWPRSTRRAGEMGLLRRWAARQFTTRVIVLMPVAIAINIVLGYTVQSGLKLPIYLDSIGTILVGVLGGPLPGLCTGALSNLIWQYAPGIGSGSQIGPFAITAAAIGLLAGVWGQLGLFRPRRGHGLSVIGAVAAVVLIGAMALYTYTRAFSSPDQFNSATFLDANSYDQPRLFFLAVMAVFVSLVTWALVLRRDVGAVFAISAGLL